MQTKHNIIYIQTVVILRTFLQSSSWGHMLAWLSLCVEKLLEDTTSGTWWNNQSLGFTEQNYNIFEQSRRTTGTCENTKKKTTALN